MVHRRALDANTRSNAADDMEQDGADSISKQRPAVGAAAEKKKVERQRATTQHITTRHTEAALHTARTGNTSSRHVRVSYFSEPSASVPHVLLPPRVVWLVLCSLEV